VGVCECVCHTVDQRNFGAWTFAMTSAREKHKSKLLLLKRLRLKRRSECGVVLVVVVLVVAVTVAFIVVAAWVIEHSRQQLLTEICCKISPKTRVFELAKDPKC